MTGPRLAQLTPEEDAAWVYAFTSAVDDGLSDEDADRLAWAAVCTDFPRLLCFDGAKP